MQPVKNLHLNDQSEITNGQFCRDVIEGLSSVPKHLDAKYFYDAKGDELFQQIMNMPEYYPTDCEMEIFSQQTAELGKVLKDEGPFDLIELGAGDATKSIHLLRGLVNSHADFKYVPIDISGHVIDLLHETLPPAVPGLKVEGIQGDYFEALDKAQHYSNRRKVVLFLGSNIGNMPVADAEAFCKTLRKYLSPGDMLLIGFDLKKDPKVILDAYNDKQGITKQFNLNLLHRINNELGADSKPDQFEHYATYDPESGACKSYLISLSDQNVSLCDETFDFKKDEYMYMEVSQKYTVEQTRRMAIQAGFKPLQDFYDSKGWFLDTVWLAL